MWLSSVALAGRDANLGYSDTRTQKSSLCCRWRSKLLIALSRMKLISPVWRRKRSRGACFEVQAAVRTFARDNTDSAGKGVYWLSDFC